MTRKEAKSKLVHQKIGLQVIDSHSHFLPYATFKSWQVSSEAIQHRIKTRTDMQRVDFPKPGEDFAKRWITELERFDISCIGMMVGPEAWEEFSVALKQYPNRFYGYANINPLQDDAEEKAKYVIRKLGFHGFKLYPVLDGYFPYDKEAYKIYHVADELGVPVLHHFGISIGASVDLRYGNPLNLQPAARDFPNVKFGIAHMGAGMFRETLLLFYQTDNVYVDTSGSNIWMRYIPYPTDLEGVLKRTIEAAGTKRIVFGTDSSMFPRGFRYDILKQQLTILQRLKVDTEELKQIFAGNVQRIMGQ